MKVTVILVGAAAISALALQHEHHPPAAGAKVQIPSSIAAEHKEIHEQLEWLASQEGDVGKAAQNLAKVMAPHFEEEEEFAMPPLGALKDLAEGKRVPNAEAIVAQTAKLKKELPRLLKEHQAIALAVEKLGKAAEADANKTGVEFAIQLARHAKQEEEVLYPAAILVGEVLKQRAPAHQCGAKEHREDSD